MQKSFIETLLPYDEILDDEAFSAVSQENKDLFLGGVVQNKNGNLLTVFKLYLGDSYLSESFIAQKRDCLSAFISTLDEHLTIYYMLNRTHSASPYISLKDNMVGTAKIIEEKREDFFDESHTLLNEVYIGVEYKKIKGNYGITNILFNEYLELLKDFIMSLNSIEVKAYVLKNETLLSLIKELLTFKKSKLLLQQKNVSLSTVFDTMEIHLDTIPIVIKDDKDEVFIRCISFNALPMYTFPDMLSNLYSYPFEMHVVYKFEPFSKDGSEKVIDNRRKQYKSSIFSLTDHMKSEFKGEDVSTVGDAKMGAVLSKSECDDALETIHKDNVIAGYFTGIIVLGAKNEDELNNNVYEIKDFMNKQGFSTRVESIGNSLLFFTSLPCYESSFRSLLVLSSNFVDMLHLSSPFIGSPKSVLLEKRLHSNVPLLYLKNLDGSTYYFSTSGTYGEKGHTFITGPTGSGKSVFLALLIASWQKYSNVRTVIIDRDLSSLNVVLSNDGEVIYPLGDNTSFKPLSQSNINGSINFLKAVASSGGVKWNANIQKDVEKVLLLLSHQNESLTDFYALLKGINPTSPLLVAISPYIIDGAYGNLFNAEADTLDNISKITLIETNKILTSSSVSFDGVALPCMIHILTKLEEAFNDSIPTLLVMDEAWKFLKNDVFRLYFEEWIKTLRKKNVDIVFSVTNISDIINTPIAETLLSNVETRIFMSDKSAEETIQKRNYESIGLSEKEIKILSIAPRFSPLIMNDGSLSVVNLCVSNVLDMLITTEGMKKDYICSIND